MLFLYLRNKNTQDYYTKKAYTEIEACLDAQKLIKDTVLAKIIRLDDHVNTSYSEFGAIQLGDSVLYFSSIRPSFSKKFNTVIENTVYSKVYASYFITSGITTGNTVGDGINKLEENVANITFNKSANKAYFSICEKKKNFYECSIYSSDYKNGKWQKPKKLPENINIKGKSATQPSVGYSEDKEILYFASNRDGGYGNIDIWATEINGNENNQVVNCGGAINTPGDDVTPFYYSDSSTLYFSSDWHTGLGGFDIFSAKGYRNSFSKANNLGYPINTSFNDLYPSVWKNDSLRTKGYLTSNRPGSAYIKAETCCNDIYSFDLKKKKRPLIIAKKDSLTIEQSIMEMLPLTLYFHNDEPEPATEKINTKKNYKNTLLDYLALKNLYYKEFSFGLSDSLGQVAINQIDNFFNIFVKKGFDQLEKFTALLLRDLRRGNDVKITIKGYTSPLNTKEYNVNLAKRRISSLINYFSEYDNGIFLPYLNGTSPDKGKLTLFEDAIGKTQANPNVSDNPNDKRNSVYSPAAGLERRIQIILYSSGNKDTTEVVKNTQAQFNSFSFDFGKILLGETVGFTFSVKNIGKENLYIRSVENDCSSLKTIWNNNAVMPTMDGLINVLLLNTVKTGVIECNIKVEMNTTPSIYYLKIKANVVEEISLPINEKPPSKKKQRR